jgi:outer membrane protein TolC
MFSAVTGMAAPPTSSSVAPQPIHPSIPSNEAQPQENLDEDIDDFGFVDKEAIRDRALIDEAFDSSAQPANEPMGPRPNAKAFLTFDEILLYGLSNPLIRAADAAVEAMEATAAQARFAWLPVLSASVALSPGVNIRCDEVALLTESGTPQNFQYCHPGRDENADVQTIKGYFSQIGDAGIALQVRGDLVMPILTFGKAIAAKKIVKAGVALARLDKIRVAQETVMRTQEAYTGLLLARESVKILNEAFSIVKKHAQPKADDGRAARDPVDQIEIEIAEVDLARKLREARRVEASALAALWAIAGDAAPPHFDIDADGLATDPLSDSLQPLQHYRELAWKQRPEAKMAKAMVEARMANEKLKQAMFFPDLAIVGRANIGYANKAEKPDQLYYTDRANYSSLQLALALRWKLDFHNRAFELQKARAELRGAEAQREAAHRLLLLDVDRAYVDFISARKDVELTDLGIRRARRLVAAHEAKATLGDASYRDLSRALTRWAEFEFEALRARANQNLALARLARAVGSSLTPATARAPSGRTPGVSTK